MGHGRRAAAHGCRGDARGAGGGRARASRDRPRLQPLPGRLRALAGECRRRSRGAWLDAAARVGGCGELVGVGGDVASCGSPPAGGWLVRVTDDHRSDPTAPGQTVSIRDGGLATSSTAVRRWRRAGASMHHIIDPRTGAPVRATWRTVSVAAADCTQANIAATAALVRAGAAAGWLDGLGLPARLIDWEGRTTLVGGWPA